MKRIFARAKAGACLGVGCLKELMLGSFACEKLGIAGQGVPLLKDGCVNTEVDWRILKDYMHLNSALAGGPHL